MFYRPFVLLALLSLSFVSAVSAHAGFLPADFRRGFNLVDIPNHPYGTEEVRSELKKLKALGVNWVSVTPIGIMPNYRANLISVTENQHSSARDYRRIVAVAHELGMKVNFKPMLFLRDTSDRPGGKTTRWHGIIEPSNPTLWFESFWNYISYYLRIAESAKADQFTIGSELMSMTVGLPEYLRHDGNQAFWYGFPGDWAKLATRAKQVYSGPISYDFNSGWEFTNFKTRLFYESTSTPDQRFGFAAFYTMLDSVGCDMYDSLMSPQDTYASDEELQGKLLENAFVLVDNIMTNLSEMNDFNCQIQGDTPGCEKKMDVKEIGFKSCENCFIDPWAYDSNVAANLKHQAFAYEAMFQAFLQPRYRSSLGGIFFWEWKTNSTAGGPADPGFTPQGKEQTLEVIRRYFR